MDFLSLLCIYNNLILTLNQKKNSHLDEGWLFIGRFKVGDALINNEVLAQFLYKPA